MGFIDELVQGISKEVGKVQARSQEMMQTYTAMSQIRELERKKTSILLQIGRSVHDKYKHHVEVTETALKQKVSEIDELDDQINALQAELDELKVQNDPDTPASKRAEAKAGYRATPGFECPNCHSPASQAKAFCPVCGEALKNDHKDEDIVDVEPNGER